MLHWTLEKRNLPLRFVWKISRSSIESKESYFLTLTDGRAQGQGEVAPNTRYNNTFEVIERDFEVFLQACRSAPAQALLETWTLPEFGNWLDSLGLCKTLRFGIESAWIHFQSARLGSAAGEYYARILKLPVVSEVKTSFSVPIMEIGKLQEFLQPLARFHALKIKVDSLTAVETVREVSRLTSQALRIDGNEAFTDPATLIHFVEGLKNTNVEFLEQPIPASMKAAYREVLPRMPFPLIADESIENTADFHDLKTQFSGVNIKLMKTGSTVRAAELLREARAHGMKTMLGCMVETSLGISSALRLCAPELVDYADLDGFLLLKEDPFRLITEDQGILKIKQ